MRKSAKFFFLAFLLLLWTTDYGLWTKCGITASAYAEVPHLINYQGRLTDKEGKPVADGAYQITFRIYDAATAGNLLWEETNPNVLIQKGIFSVLLGSVTNLNLAFDKPYFLEIKVSDEVMSPRQLIASAGYAIRAEKAEQTDKIKLNSSDSSPGYLADKVDNQTIKIDPQTNKLYVNSPYRSQLFISSGSFTAPAGVDEIFITMCGGGGGGGGSQGNPGGDRAGGGGGGGACLNRFRYAVTPGAQYTATVGTGGAAGQPGPGDHNGGDGSNSSFGNLSVAGGSKGLGFSQAGGIGGAGTINYSLNASEVNGGIAGQIAGGKGADGRSNIGGGGGASYFSNGGRGGTNAQAGTAGTSGSGGGGGGCGGTGNDWPGGKGGDGFILVEW
jgi:hypothetical protein